MGIDFRASPPLFFRWAPGSYKVKRILAHRVKADGTKQYNAEWEDKEWRHDKSWWLDADRFTQACIDEYEETRITGLPRTMVEVDASLYWQNLRRHVAHALVMPSKASDDGFQGCHRPRIHEGIKPN